MASGPTCGRALIGSGLRRGIEQQAGLRSSEEGTNMKKDIHPEYKTATVKCVCGNEFETRSTVDEISVEICSACHPFFTGQQKLVDSAGRVERFMRKYGEEYAASSDKRGQTGKLPAEPAPKEKAPAKDAGAPESETPAEGKEEPAE